MDKVQKYKKGMQKQNRKRDLSKARKKARPNASRKKPRQKNWEQFQGDEWDNEGFYSEERVMPKGHEEHRKEVQEMISKPAAVAIENFQEESDLDRHIETLKGTVIEVTTGTCTVSVDGNPIACYLRGALKLVDSGYTNVVAVGDWVEVSLEADGRGVVEAVLPRRSVLARTAASLKGKASGQRQVVAANIDRVLIVASWRKPKFWPELIDRYLIAAERNHLEAVICVNKIDLVDNPDEFEATLKPYRDLGYDVLTTSAEEKNGIDTLTEFLKGQLNVLAGLSGVGKSSLLSAVQPGLNLKALAVGERGKNKNQGRHTTRMATYYPLSGGGAVIDTPGIRDFGLTGLSRNEVKFYYPEFTEVSANCSFRDCLHLHEPDCAVRTGIGSGGVSQLRYENYVKIMESMEA